MCDTLGAKALWLETRLERQSERFIIHLDGVVASLRAEYVHGQENLIREIRQKSTRARNTRVFQRIPPPCSYR